MENKGIKFIVSIGNIFVNGNKYSMITEYKHYTKEADGEIHDTCLERRTSAVDIIDVTMPVFYEELNNLKYGSTLEYVGEVYEGKSNKLEKMSLIGETKEVYFVEKSQFFIKESLLHDIGSVTYRFYVSEIERSNYRYIDNDVEKE